MVAMVEVRVEMWCLSHYNIKQSTTINAHFSTTSPDAVALECLPIFGQAALGCIISLHCFCHLAAAAAALVVAHLFLHEVLSSVQFVSHLVTLPQVSGRGIQNDAIICPLNSPMSTQTVVSYRR